VCQREGLGITPWSPLAGGWLTGRYKRDAAPEKGSRVEWYDKMNFEGLSSKAVASGQVWAVLDALARVAGELRASQAQVALRWVMQRAGVASTIIGVNRVAQLEENARACALALSPEQMRALAAASAPETPYPYSFINRMNGRQ
jgi:aryl-alcohol dehydrogenase-like predicted oxidoreductase